MANPSNKLDKFVTYTTHFELHASSSWPELKAIESTDNPKASTDPKHANGTLLINTRCDAHQHIDNVHMNYAGPLSNPDVQMSTMTLLTLEVTEPNGTSFMEKIQNLQTSLKVKSITTGIVFGLKIFFVGRLDSGAIETIPFSKIIPLHLNTLDAKFDHRGGIYQMGFIQAGTALSISSYGSSNIGNAVGYINKTISFKASTVQEAFSVLESKLNEHYENVYKTKLLNINGAKSLKYKFILSPEISGDLNLSTNDTYVKGDKAQLSFQTTMDVGSMLRTILNSSKEILKNVADSKEGLKVEDHPNVKLPMIIASYDLQNSQAVATYNVVLYKGGGETYEFDYYFSGKNVDILDFEVKFINLFLWLEATARGVTLNNSLDSTSATFDPNHHAQAAVHPDTTREEEPRVSATKVPIQEDSGGVAILPASTPAEDKGYARLSTDTVEVARLAFSTFTQSSATTSNQLSLSIRGYLQFLEMVVVQPKQSEPNGFGTDRGLWVKVNIFDKDHNPFYYTGKYRVNSIENIFQGGKFLQLIQLSMMDQGHQGQ